MLSVFQYWHVYRRTTRKSKDLSQVLLNIQPVCQRALTYTLQRERREREPESERESHRNVPGSKLDFKRLPCPYVCQYQPFHQTLPVAAFGSAGSQMYVLQVWLRKAAAAFKSRHTAQKAFNRPGPPSGIINTSSPFLRSKHTQLREEHLITKSFAVIKCPNTWTEYMKCPVVLWVYFRHWATVSAPDCCTCIVFPRAAPQKWFNSIL